MAEQAASESPNCHPLVTQSIRRLLSGLRSFQTDTSYRWSHQRLGKCPDTIQATGLTQTSTFTLAPPRDQWQLQVISIHTKHAALSKYRELEERSPALANECHLESETCRTARREATLAHVLAKSRQEACQTHYLSSDSQFLRKIQSAVRGYYCTELQTWRPRQQKCRFPHEFNHKQLSTELPIYHHTIGNEKVTTKV